jgi:hypothetical protein
MEKLTSESFDQDLMFKWIEEITGFGSRRAGSQRVQECLFRLIMIWYRLHYGIYKRII